jgi:glycosyltransferase involved in cell wall biosynthesis
MNKSFQALKVAFLEEYFWYGGSISFEINLAGEFARRGMTVRMVCLNDKHDPPPDFVRLGIPTTSESSQKIFEDRVAGAVEKLNAFKPDVVIANLAYGSCEVLRYLPPDVFRIGVVHAESQMKLIPVWAEAIDCVVTVSESTRNFLAGEFGNRLKVEFVELGIPLSAAGKREQRPIEAPLRILYLGRLEDYAKRVRLFPAIFARLKQSGIPFIWTIAGNGPERSFLEENMRSDNDWQRVLFKGLVPYVEVPALLAENDVLLLTSNMETFSLSLHEGMTAGLVPVVSDLQGRVGQMVTPERGIRVPLDNVDGYADAIIRLHRNRDEWHRMSVASTTAIGQECSVAAMADRWLAIMPPPPEKPTVWPKRWKLQTPLFAGKNRWWFSSPMRVVRRLTARVRRPTY